MSGTARALNEDRLTAGIPQHSNRDRADKQEGIKDREPSAADEVGEGGERGSRIW